MSSPKKEYDFIVGIGEDCACSMYLRKHNLQIKSFPFDWLTNASFETRLEMILNNFQDFLNLEDLRFLPKDLAVFNDKNCDYYENTKNGFYYYHDFPVGSNLEDKIIEVQTKYDRRIKRFYEMVSKAEKVLFVWLSHTKNTDHDLIVSLNQKINEKFGKEIDFLIIENDSSKTGEDFLITELSKNVVKYSLDTASWDISQDKTLGNIQNCDGIFKRYRLSISLVSRLRQKIIIAVVKFFTTFIPFREMRKNSRQYLLDSFGI